MLYDLLLYFSIGVFYDFLITYYYIKIIEKAIILSGIMSFIITMVQVFILYHIILLSSDSNEAIAKTVAYALGCGFGTSLTIYFKNKRLWSNKNKK